MRAGLTAAELADHQLRWLRTVVRAAEDVEPYRSHWKPSSVAEALRAPDTDGALACLPVLPNALLRTTPLEARRTAPAPEGTSVRFTSGSTGDRFAYEYPPGGSWWLGVLSQRADTPGRRRMTLGQYLPSRSPGLLGRLSGWRSSGVLGSEEAQAEMVRRVRPKRVAGLGKNMVAVGRALRADGWRPGGWPSEIRTGGGVLEDDTRRAIADLWGRPPIDVYSATETGPIAEQCAARDLYHIVCESVVVEVLDDAGEAAPPDKVGDLVVTNLWNRLSPLIRYGIDDRGAIAGRACRCGFVGPALRSVDGRVWDWLWDGAGGRIPPQRLWLSYLMAESWRTRVRAYQVHQFRDGRVVVDIACELPPDVLEDVQRKAVEVFEGRIPVEVRCAASLDFPSERWRSVSSDYWSR
ncbi:MAG: hypothetical protein ACRD6W_12130 [Nitrososphaerales archaeon]